MATCATDADCRTSEGYVCDRAWRACTMPNSAAIIPRTCDAPRGIGRDPAFAPATALFDAREAAAVVRDGKLVADKRSSLAQKGGTLFSTFSENGIMVSTSKDAETWNATKIDPCFECRSTIVIGANVHVLIAGVDGLRVRTSRDGKTFGDPVTALAGGHGSATLGADGRLHVVGVEGGALGGYGSANQRIQYTVSADGARTFARPITVSKRDEVVPFYFATPAIAVDSRRKWIYIAYVRGGRDARWDIMLAASKDNGKTWARSRIGDDPPCAIHMEPHLALDPTTGAVHVAWYDSRGLRFAHAVCAIGLAKCTQVGRINDVPFATLSTTREGATSIGETQTLVVDDKRRELHAVWAQPVDDAGKTVLRVFHAKAKLPLR